MKLKDITAAVFIAALISLLAPGNAMATLDQAKLYQKVFGGDKPKCITCHVDKIPKKEDGKHDWNEYGKKLHAEASKQAPDESVYKKIGKNEKAVY